MALDAAELTFISRRDLEVSIRKSHEDIKKIVKLQFGVVSPEVGVLIDATETEEELDILFERAFHARTEDDLLHPTKPKRNDEWTFGVVEC